MADFAKVQYFQLLKKVVLGGASRALLCLIFVITPLFAAQADFGSIVDIGLAGDFYFTDESANNGQGYVNLLIQNTWSESQLWVDLGAGGLVGDTASSYVKAPQLYYRMGNKDKLHWVIGRALHDWSFADQFWNLGVVQPVFSWDATRPEQQGLTGLFVHYPIIPKKLQATFFISGLYLPTQGPSYELTDGELDSSNPWFTDVIEILNLSGGSYDTRYAIDIPDTKDVVFQASYGFQVGTPFNKRGLLANAFFVDKPGNDLMLPFDGNINPTPQTADIDVLPRVARHQVVGADFGWNFRRSKSIVSFLYESPLDYAIPAGSTFPIYGQQTFLSFQQLFRLTRSQRLTFAYIHNDRKDTEIGGSLPGIDIPTFNKRNRFDDAFRVRWEGLLFKTLSEYRLQASLTYTHSLINNDAWVSADLNWSIYKGLEAFTRCDLFGGSDDTIQGQDFISSHLNNDRCLVGGHYAF